MAFRPGWPAELVAGPVRLRPPRRRDARDWGELRRRNREWLSPWEPTSPSSWDERSTRGSWYALLRLLRSGARTGTALPFVIEYGGRLVGQLNVSNVVRGALQSATVGYWVDAAVAGRGIAPTALALSVDHCFRDVGLHRIEVDIRPDNAPSLRVVQKLGLRQEGCFERYLDIDGAWRDHLAFAITAEELGSASLLSRLPTLPLPPG